MQSTTRKLLIAGALAITLVLALTLIAKADIPPEPEPPAWDKSSISVEATCRGSDPVFTITNGGSGNMEGPSTWYFLDTQGGASTCAADVAAGYILSGTYQLQSGASVEIDFDSSAYAPPYRLCVQQRAGHPGTGWGSATAETEGVTGCGKPTAIDVVEEPSMTRFMFLPFAGKRISN
jgi:hypothetical protein